MNSLDEFRKQLRSLNSEFEVDIPKCGGCIDFSNTPRRGERKFFTLSFDALISSLDNIIENRSSFAAHTHYKETAWRILGERYITEGTSRTMVAVQTKPFFVIMNKLVHVSAGHLKRGYHDQVFLMDTEDLVATIEQLRRYTR
tara:strand:- start:91 stop:519 length:429 start_codon:yes stop_codon:yes gene_type:complete